MGCGEPEVIDGVVWDGKRMKVYLANPKILARFDWLNAITQCGGTFARFFVGDVLSLTDVGLASLGGNINGAIY
jgi:hypothetical protein